MLASGISQTSATKSGRVNWSCSAVHLVQVDQGKSPACLYRPPRSTYHVRYATRMPLAIRSTSHCPFASSDQLQTSLLELRKLELSAAGELPNELRCVVWMAG